jgi:hypothetical protein
VMSTLLFTLDKATAQATLSPILSGGILYDASLSRQAHRISARRHRHLHRIYDERALSVPQIPGHYAPLSEHSFFNARRRTLEASELAKFCSSRRHPSRACSRRMERRGAEDYVNALIALPSHATAWIARDTGVPQIRNVPPIAILDQGNNRTVRTSPPSLGGHNKDH